MNLMKVKEIRSHHTHMALLLVFTLLALAIFIPDATITGSTIANITTSENNITELNETITSTVNESNATEVIENITQNITEPIENITINKTIESNITEINITQNETIQNTTVEIIESNIIETTPNVTIEVNETIGAPIEVIEPLQNLTENTTESNITTPEPNLTQEIKIVNAEVLEEETTQYPAVIGQTVKWKKVVKLKEKASNLEIELPKEVTITAIKKIENNILIDITEEEGKPASNSLTGAAVIEESNATSLIVEQEVEEIEIEYETEAPQVLEEETQNGKRITISSETHYENILTFMTIPEAKQSSINLYWIINNSRVSHKIIEYVDNNNNELIDEIYWITPHLSNQTFEAEITILNVQSYPTLFGNWTVNFNTTGTANLTIEGINGTAFGTDLSFLSLTCGNSPRPYNYSENKVTSENWNCDNKTGAETSNVTTAGKHTLQFTFGNDTAYAYNQVSITACQNISSAGHYQVTQNISSTGNICLNISVDDVDLECQGFTIAYNLVGIHSGTSNLGTTPLGNITVRDCNLEGGRDAIVFTNTDNSTIVDNRITTNPSGGQGSGILIRSGSTDVVTNRNNITTSGTVANNYGIEITSSSELNVTNNNVSTHDNGSIDVFSSSNNYGIFGNAISNSLFTGNNISTNGSGQDSIGFYLISTSTNNNITKNEILSSGGAEGHTITFDNGPGNNTVEYNNLTTRSNTSGFFVVKLSGASDNNITGNNISANSQGTAVGVDIGIEANRNVILRNEILTGPANSVSDYGIRVQSSTNNNITLNRITTMGQQDNHGFKFDNNANNTIVEGNNITTSGTLSDAVYQEDATNNTFINNRMNASQASSKEWHSRNTVRGSVVTNLTFIRNEVTVTFKDQNGTNIKGIRPGDASASVINTNAIYNLSKFVNMSGNSLASVIFINFSYNSTDVTNFNETRLTIWKYITSWSSSGFTSSSGVDETNNVVFANITDLLDGATYGVFADRRPTITRVDINSTDPTTNNTDQNLTIYPRNVTDAEGDQVQNITNWLIDSDSLTVFNFPFDTNTTTNFTIRDYSDNGFNGSVRGTPTYRGGSDCIKGGCYEFTGGSNDAIHTYNLTHMGLNNRDNRSFTITMWVNTTSFSSLRYLLSDEDSSPFETIIIRTDGANIDFLLHYNGGLRTLQLDGSGNITLNRWHFLAFAFNGSEQRVYANGVRKATSVSGNGSLLFSAQNITIGGHPTITTRGHTGRIDEVKFFNRVLSDQQILLMNNSDGIWETIVSQETEGNENWSACVTPNDGFTDGNTVCSQGLNIFEEAPPTSTLTNPPNATSNSSTSHIFVSTGTDSGALVNATLYHNISGSWLANQTLTRTGISNDTNFSVTSIIAGGYTWNVLWCDDSSNCTFASSNFTFTVNSGPNVTLNNPPDTTSNDSTSHIFNANFSDDRALVNATLYHNISGSWLANQTNTLNGTSNSSNFSVANIPLGNYIWNVLACDGDNLCTFASSNFTFAVIDSPPTIISVDINSTDPTTNNTDQNLTIYPRNVTDVTSANVQNITNWLMNGSTLARLNFAFDTNTLSNIRDYSQSFNGSVRDTPTYRNGTDCIKGGCYEFTGGSSDAVITVNLTDIGINLSNTPFTITMWVNLTSFASTRYFISYGLGAGYTFQIFTNGSDVEFDLQYNSASRRVVLTGGNITLGRWNFYAFTFNGSEHSIFFSGTRKITNVAGNGSMTINDNNITIGGPSFITPPFGAHTGRIDEVKIFNRVLSDEQILLMNNSDGIWETIVSQETRTGQNWSGCVTPNDGNTDGSTVCSENLTIGGAIPDNPPTINLINPPDTTNNRSNNHLFFSNATEDFNLANATLYHNISGSWLANQTNSSITGTFNETTFSVANIPLGTYEWNVEYCDNSSQCNQADSNFTFTFTGCGNLSESYTLTQNLTRTGTCFLINTSNVVLDCNNFALIGSGTGAGVHARDLENITVQNCRIEGFGNNINFGGTNYSLLLNNTILNSTGHSVALNESANNNTILNNTIDNSVRGVSGTETLLIDGVNYTIVDNLIINNRTVGLTIVTGNNSRIENNTIRTNASEALFITTSRTKDYHIENNTLHSNESSAIFLNGNSYTDNLNMTIRLNRLSADTTGVGLFLSTVAGVYIDRNNITVNTTNGWGVNLDGYNNSFTNNTIREDGSSFGLEIITGEYNNFSYNTIIARANVALRNHVGSDFGGFGKLNTFLNNTISTDTGTAISLDTIDNNFTNTIIRSNATWISATGTTSGNNRFNNTIFENANGSIRIIGFFNASNVTGVNQSNLNISFNRAVINTSNLAYLNTSSIITLRGITSTNPEPIIDTEDDGTFRRCQPPECNEISFSGNVFVYNTTHFTTHGSNETNSFPSSVNLINPPNATSNSTTSHIFVSNATDSIGLANATLYHNINGSWLANQTLTRTGTSNDSNFSVTNIAIGSYVWNVLWCDDINQCNFSVSNFTFTITAVAQEAGGGQGTTSSIVSGARPQTIINKSVPPAPAVVVETDRDKNLSLPDEERIENATLRLPVTLRLASRTGWPLALLILLGLAIAAREITYKRREEIKLPLRMRKLGLPSKITIPTFKSPAETFRTFKNFGATAKENLMQFTRQAQQSGPFLEHKLKQTRAKLQAGAISAEEFLTDTIKHAEYGITALNNKIIKAAKGEKRFLKRKAIDLQNYLQYNKELLIEKIETEKKMLILEHQKRVRLAKLENLRKQREDKIRQLEEQRQRIIEDTTLTSQEFGRLEEVFREPLIKIPELIPRPEIVSIDQFKNDKKEFEYLLNSIHKGLAEKNVELAKENYEALMTVYNKLATSTKDAQNIIKQIQDVNTKLTIASLRSKTKEKIQEYKAPEIEIQVEPILPERKYPKLEFPIPAQTDIQTDNLHRLLESNKYKEAAKVFKGLDPNYEEKEFKNIELPKVKVAPIELPHEKAKNIYKGKTIEAAEKDIKMEYLQALLNQNNYKDAVELYHDITNKTKRQLKNVELPQEVKIKPLKEIEYTEIQPIPTKSELSLDYLHQSLEKNEYSTAAELFKNVNPKYQHKRIEEPKLDVKLTPIRPVERQKEYNPITEEPTKEELTIDFLHDMLDKNEYSIAIQTYKDLDPKFKGTEIKKPTKSKVKVAPIELPHEKVKNIYQNKETEEEKDVRIDYLNALLDQNKYKEAMDIYRNITKTSRKIITKPNSTKHIKISPIRKNKRYSIGNQPIKKDKNIESLYKSIKKNELNKAKKILSEALNDKKLRKKLLR